MRIFLAVVSAYKVCLTNTVMQSNLSTISHQVMILCLDSWFLQTSRQQ